MPPKPKDVDEGIIRGLYRLRGAPKGDGPVVRLVASGPIMLQAFEAVELLEEFGVRCEIWSATSYGELRREGLEVARWNRQNPDKEAKQPWVQQQLGSGIYPTIAVSDNMAAVPDMIRQWVGGDYSVLGTDGFGKSDTRPALRRFFEIDAVSVTLAALSSLVRDGSLDAEVYAAAEKKFTSSNQVNDIADS
jgi:pyruvate dehydrogenase E1 component